MLSDIPIPGSQSRIPMIPSCTAGQPIPRNDISYGSCFFGHVLTVSSLNPKTDALDKIVSSMKLNIYVVNNSGINRLSIFLSTDFAMAWSVHCSPSGLVVSMAISSKKKGGCRESHSRQFDVFFSSYKVICPVIFPRTSHWSNPCVLSMQTSFAN